MISSKKILLFFLLTQYWIITAQQVEKKTYHKELEVLPNALIEIENQFGDLKMTSWDENRVVIDILITVEGNNNKRLAEKLEDISVYFELEPDHIVAKTRIEEEWVFTLFGRSRLKYRIDYTVKLPRSSRVDLDNDYGTIILNTLDGAAKISCDYGKIVVGTLNSESNFLAFDYTKNSSFEFILGGEIKADFSEFEVQEAGQVDLEADYTTSEFNTIQRLNYKNDFGKLLIDKINTLEGKGDYLTLKIGTLFQEASLNNEFGLIRIDQVMPSTKSLLIDSEYCSIQLGIAPEWEFQHEIDLDFAGLKSTLALEHSIQKSESTEKYYKGFHRNNQSLNQLKITSEFGSVKLTSKP